LRIQRILYVSPGLSVLGGTVTVFLVSPASGGPGAAAAGAVATVVAAVCVFAVIAAFVADASA